ncbi:MAG: glucosamine kinase [Flavobacteriales bacterium]|jgi:glucosamine kinase
MIAIADSGSTKADWAFVEQGGERADCHSMGLNPYFHSSDFIRETLMGIDGISGRAAAVTEVYFFGAGASTDVLKEVVAKGLRMVFPNAKVLVRHDLDGSAFATCYGGKGIACILGTGSNSCIFDGEEVSEEIPALGHILGDEGSGSYIGKQLLRDFFYKKMPADVSAAFASFSKLDKDGVIEKVYQGENVNVYLASLCVFLEDFRDEDYTKQLLINSFTDFLDIHVSCYANWWEYPVHFTGSVAFYFKTELEMAVAAFGAKMGRIEQRPIDGLVEYFGPDS